MVSSATLDEVKKRLVETYRPEEIYLFGSYAWGQPDDMSDLDLLVIVGHSDEKSYKRAIPGIRSLIGLRIAKDILVYTKAEFEKLSGDVSSLLYKIKIEGKKIYAAISDVATKGRS